MSVNFRRIKKWLLAASAVAFVFAATSLFILYFTNTGYEFRSNAKKYVDMNISQNWGIQKKILVTIDRFLTLMPLAENIDFDKESAPQGAKINKSAISPLLAEAKNIIKVEDELSLVVAISNAVAGDFILVSPGIYTIKQRNIRTKWGGTKKNPIVLAASRLGDVEIKFDSLEGLLITEPYWIVKNLSFEGICLYDGSCEHAIHLYGDADHIVIENNIFRNFNAPLKSNGNYSTEKASFPDFITISNNDFYNDRLRKTDLPTVAMDVVGGNGWLIKNNFIADYARKLKGRISEVYMAFIKGAGQGSRFEGNVINCAWRVPHQSSLDIRVGFSLGNGGTAERFCQDGRCEYEHLDGQIKRNLILNCRNDVGIYLNKASSTKISENVLLNTYGIDARFPQTSASINQNILHGRIKSRDGGFINQRDNNVLSPGEIPDDELIRVILSQR